MRIESIEESKRGKLRLCFDDGNTILVAPAVVSDMGLYRGMDMPDDARERLREASGLASAKARAVRIISAAAMSKQALYNRLLQKGESEAHAAQAVQWLDSLNLLDDTQVAHQIVRGGVSKGYGAARIRQMLYEKRIPRELWDDALSLLPEQDDTLDRFLRQRFRGTQPDRAEIKRATDALLRRGHTWEDIKSALGRYAHDEE